MRKMLSASCCILIFSLCAVSQAFPFGEDILALSGQYTFFIKPVPGSNVTYYQKMVPCTATDECPVPRRVAPVFPVPVSQVRNQPVTRTEIPVGCAEGCSDCIKCRPRPSTSAGVGEMVVPRMVPFPVPGVEPVPRTITRKIMLPQWFEVREESKEVRKVHKIR
ncbi:MAG TPA: hypothetical protein VK463_07995 [Desulfomonilaceae bacterium]|nr:hypothetical protein [Desulfomonilaceae bacterium]